jgi:hypothetical protein
VPKVVEDGQGLPPGVAGRRAVTYGLVSVAEVDAYHVVAETATEIAGEIEGALVTGDSVDSR